MPKYHLALIRHLAVLVLVAATGAEAQFVVRVPDAAVCPACKITAGSRVLLGGPGDAVTIEGHPSAVRVDGTGRFWVMQEGALPIVFSPQGRSPRFVGRRGQGPGEFASAYDVLPLTGDSVLVFDDVTRRATLLDLSFRPVRSVPMPVRVNSAVVLEWPRSVIANAFSRTARGASHSLHHLSFDPDKVTTLRSFGPADNELVAHEAGIVQQFLTTTPGGHLWSAGLSGYNLYEWTSPGVLTLTLRRRPSWFSDVHAGSIGSPTTPPKPMLAGISADSEGLVWVYTRIPASSWMLAWPKLPPGTREVRTRDIAWHLLYDTMIEVIDPRLRRVVARSRYDGAIVSALSGRRAAFEEADVTGNLRVPVVTFDLTGRKPTR